MPTPTLHCDLPELANDYDHVVIDGAPGRHATSVVTVLTRPVRGICQVFRQDFHRQDFHRQDSIKQVLRHGRAM
jgi:hypothetical protein